MPSEKHEGRLHHRSSRDIGTPKHEDACHSREQHRITTNAQVGTASRHLKCTNAQLLRKPEQTPRKASTAAATGAIRNANGQHADSKQKT
eukprot:15475525-Alexandrium_andersonii.AAC.1